MTIRETFLICLFVFVAKARATNALHKRFQVFSHQFFLSNDAADNQKRGKNIQADGQIFQADF